MCSIKKRSVRNWKSCKSCIVGTPWTWVNRIDNTGNLALGNWNCAFSTGRNSSPLEWQHVLVYLAAGLKFKKLMNFKFANQDLDQNYKVVNLLSMYNSNIQKGLEKDTSVFQSFRSEQKRLHPRPLIQKSPHLRSLPYMQWVLRDLFCLFFSPCKAQMDQVYLVHCSKSTCPLRKIHMSTANHENHSVTEHACYRPLCWFCCLFRNFGSPYHAQRACNRHDSTIQEPYYS
jgi:hypothetical protein